MKLKQLQPCEPKSRHDPVNTRDNSVREHSDTACRIVEQERAQI